MSEVKKWVYIDKDNWISTYGCGCCSEQKEMEDAKKEDIVELIKNLSQQLESATRKLLELK